MTKRIGVIGIVVQGDRTVVSDLQEILTDYGDIIIGRMGVPDKENGIYAISVVVKGNPEEINALSGKIGRLSNVKVKSAINTIEIDN